MFTHVCFTGVQLCTFLMFTLYLVCLKSLFNNSVIFDSRFKYTGRHYLLTSVLYYLRHFSTDCWAKSNWYLRNTKFYYQYLYLLFFSVFCDFLCFCRWKNVSTTFWNIYVKLFYFSHIVPHTLTTSKHTDSHSIQKCSRIRHLSLPMVEKIACYTILWKLNFNHT